MQKLERGRQDVYRFLLPLQSSWGYVPKLNFINYPQRFWITTFGCRSDPYFSLEKRPFSSA
jgi:hypothetical protein